MYSPEVSEEFWSSPASIRNGRPLTTSSFPLFVSRKCGIDVFSGDMVGRRAKRE
jgi:hypothetical protein